MSTATDSNLNISAILIPSVASVIYGWKTLDFTYPHGVLRWTYLPHGVDRRFIRNDEVIKMIDKWQYTPTLGLYAGTAVTS